MIHKISENPPEKTAVLIAGGGISGLSAALFLREQGITPILVERHRTTSVHPRARGFDVRTMELYRGLQLAGAIREAGKALAPAWGIHQAPSMAAFLKNKKPRKKKNGSPMLLKGLQKLTAQSPELGARCTQDLSEPVLLRAAIERGADIRFFTELLSFTQDENGVTAILHDRESGRQYPVRADYLLAADGARSPIRESLQAATLGPGALGNLLNIYFTADLKEKVEGKEFSILRIDEPGIRGLLTAINNSDRWVFHLSWDPAAGKQAQDFTEEELTAVLQKVLGYDGTRIRIISILPWQPTVKAVQEMQHGRTFLAGDAAHIMPPYGGKGANTGIQDVHNLAWKLALVIQKKAGPGLLSTYSAERQAIGWHNAERSGRWADQYGLIKGKNLSMLFTFLPVLAANFLKLDLLFPDFPMKKLGWLLGFPEMQYPAAGHTQPAYQQVSSLSGLPGTRFPHHWVTYGGNIISTLDLLGKDFVLFTGTDHEVWKKAAAIVSQETGLPLPVYNISQNSTPDASHPQAAHHHSGGALYPENARKPTWDEQAVFLVRPDGFVAWKSARQLTETPLSVLRKALSAWLFPE